MNTTPNPTHAPHANATTHAASPSTVQVKSVVIGSGRPKIVVPITATDQDEAHSMAQAIAASPVADLAEFRIDYLRWDWPPSRVSTLCQSLTEILKNKPLLVTFRTKDEGGARAISADDYEALYTAVLRDRAADLIDLQMMIERPHVARLVALARQQEVAVVISHHDFQDTPETSVLISRLREQQDMGADILKIAAMPHGPGDTLRLMQATWEMYSRHARQPLLSMAMGPDGVVSRLSGALTGSALSYGSIGASSAPGQLDAGDLYRILSIIDTSAHA
ncbi:type I 3-dehydroquinate dehydratase [Robbsia sp. KACC 23696]|uniref:type I 3-dehydroquinate dehydratase n=1 Tax=Robbsia sp. KACC 23696 TaxID=3149231 RepID=UPI00325A99EA